MENKSKLVEIFPPGEFIQEELDARGWLKSDFAEILGVDKKTVGEIVSGKRSITPEMAKLIGAAFGTGPNVWLNLDNEYQLQKTPRNDSRNAQVSRKAKLFGDYPVREMLKRGWLSKEPDTLESELARFFARGDNLPYAARKKEDDSKLPLQLAWLHRTYNIAKTMQVGAFSDIKFARAMNKLKEILIARDCIDEIPEILKDSGVRFIINQSLPSSKIDGVCFWLDERSPVVALSLRWNRIDNFWFTLMHELHHVRFGHAKETALLDVGIDERNDNISAEERQADEGATEFLVSQEELNRFIARVRPAFTPIQIKGFSTRIGVHPGIVLGQLHHRGVIDYKYHRKMLVSVRELITRTAMFDGWGMIA